MKIGVFGGTFNPPHLGHVNICREFSRHIGFDRLLIIPTFMPPHKSCQELISPESRGEMCRIAFSEFENAEISMTEIERKGKSYTYDTLCEIKELYPDSEIFFIMGSDMMVTFTQWYRWQDILKLCTLCAAQRDEGNELTKYLSHFPEKVIYLPVKPFEVSSTQIRNMVKKGEDISHLVGKDTAEYIKKEGLYRNVQ